ncbi:MAG: Sec-independent protein translocase subunit TatA [Alcaligenaceae bacterium]|nr:Sec-independent protein translocase subunit TatA [Alcaligenaceae bacterium]
MFSSVWEWIIILLVVVLIFGTKRLKNVGSDLGEAVKGFKKGMQDDEKSSDPVVIEAQDSKETVLDGSDSSNEAS